MRTLTATTRCEPERGTTLVIVTIMVIGVAALSMGLMLEALAERTSVTHQETSQLALDAAETGIVKAEQEIRGLVDPDGDGVGTITGTHGGGHYTVTATQDADTAERWRIVATGTHGLSTRRVEVGIRRRGRQLHVESLYSREELDFGGSSQTDAYDSRSGTYASQAVSADASGTYARGGGHIGSGKGIVLHGSSTTIRGNAVPGPLHQVSLNGTPVVWGDTLPRQRAIDLPITPYNEFEAAYLSNDNASLRGTNALGAEGAQEMEAVSATDLSGLSQAEVAGFEAFNTLLADDQTLDPMTYDELLAQTYTTKLTVDATSLLLTSGELLQPTYGLVAGTGGTTGFVLVQPVSLESTTGDTTTTTNGNKGGGKKDSDTSTPTPAPSTKPGRVSYNPDTMELRATAGAAVVLDGGTYFFSNIKLVGRAYLYVMAPSTIYVTGDLDLGGGAIVNESGRPADLRILAHPYALPPAMPSSASTIKIRGGAGAAAVIYAPEADVTIGGGDELYGSVVARGIRVLGNVSFHYDVALGESGSSLGATLERLYWRELSAPPR